MAIKSPYMWAVAEGDMSRWFLASIVIGLLTIGLGIFMLTLQVCTAAIVGPGVNECIATRPAFLFSGSFTVLLGILMFGSGIGNWYMERS